MTDLDERLRRLFDAPPAILLDEVRSRRPGWRLSLGPLVAAPAVLATVAAAIVFGIVGGHPGGSVVRVGPAGPVSTAPASTALPRSGGSPPASTSPVAGGSSSTTLAPQPDPRSLRVVLRAPGVGGSTLTLSASHTSTTTCYRVTSNDHGGPTAPGKPAWQPFSSCISGQGVNAVSFSDQPHGQVAGSLWVSRGGARYMIDLGRAPAGTAKVVFRSGHEEAVAVIHDRWWLVALPEAYFHGRYTETALDARGKVVATASTSGW